MQEAYSRRNEFYISDSAGFFMSNVARFVDRDYLPTQEREIDTIHTGYTDTTYDKSLIPNPQ